MNNLAVISTHICQLCEQKAVGEPDERCANCRNKGDFVGNVVWHIVQNTVREANPTERITFMLAGLPAVFLEGIARQASNQGEHLENRSLCLAMNPSAAKLLRVVSPAIVSDESAVHWRHSNAADVILFAPSDAEREGIGAGLGPIARIDDRLIVEQTVAWVEQLNETGRGADYLRAMLDGLRLSQIFIDLEMWVDFIAAIHLQGFSLLPHIRVQKALPALRIPYGGATKLPAYKPNGNPKARPQDFRTAFQIARAEVGVYAGLMTPKQEPVDTGAVRSAVEAYVSQDDKDENALKAVIALLDDEAHIRPGEWRMSQQAFCEEVPWDRIGAVLFEGGRRTQRKHLGSETLVFLEGNYSEDLTDDDRKLLDQLPNAVPKEPKDEELEFFEKWQERLNHPSTFKLYKSWQKRLFAKEVVGHDLLSAFSEGFEALIIAGADALGDMDDPRILVRASQHNKAMFWESLDKDVHQLFRFELGTVKGIFGDRVQWDIDACFKYWAEETSTSKEERKIDLELFLIDGELASNAPPLSAPRVKASWQPSQKGKDDSISLALPKDIEALGRAIQSQVGIFRHHIFAPRGESDDAQVFATTLKDIKTFSDIAQTQEGRTFHTTIKPQEDVISELKASLNDMKNSQSIGREAADKIWEAIDTFYTAYKDAILAIFHDPCEGFKSDLLVRQALAFGNLCEVSRRYANSDRAKKEIRSRIAEIGVVCADSSTPMAILTAWHPFRLVERQAKIQELADFVDDVLSSQAALNTDLSIVFEEKRTATERWVFPEVAVVEGKTMTAVEDVAGYSLLVPADAVSRSQGALEGSACHAAGNFIEGVNQYLDVHPHESTNLSVAIYDSNSHTLPRELARLLAQRIHRDSSLRCDFVITHHDQERLRSIYRHQNMRLHAENLSEMSKGFLSRLRVDVRSNQSSPMQPDSIRDMDLVFLHDAVSHYATPIWSLENTGTDKLSESFDTRLARKPRRRLNDAAAPGVGVYLTLPHPPQAIAHYQNLLYEIDKDAVLPDGCHGVLIRHVQFDDDRVIELIQRAHALGEWVVSYDTIANRTLLEKCGVQIIRDMSASGAKGRVIISAGKVDERLKANIQRDIIETCNTDLQEAIHLSGVVLKDVLQISGQKILSAARFSNASHEMLGLSIMRSRVEACLSEKCHASLWVSLDDYRSWFMSGKGKVADAISVTVYGTGENFRVYLQVGEAKFIGTANESVETKDALMQVRDTVKRLCSIFIDNPDNISREAWCMRLGDLLINHDGLSELLPDAATRTAFLDALCVGDVAFQISGEAVICLNDHHGNESELITDAENPHIRSHRIPSPTIFQTLRASADGDRLTSSLLQKVEWYLGQPVEEKKATAVAHQYETPDVHVVNGKKAIEHEFFLQHADSVQQLDLKSINLSTEPPTGQVKNKYKEGNELSNCGTSPAMNVSQASTFLPKPVHDALIKMALHEQGAIDDPASIAWAENVGEQIQQALSHFGMQAEFTYPRYRLTPNGALISFKGHHTLTVDKVEKRTGELLTTYGVEVTDVRPGRGQISLFVKRDNRAKVPLASTWLQAPWPEHISGIMTSFILGAREDQDSLLFLNLSEAFAGYEEHGPHTLIAGETGSGKGILTQSLLLQLTAFNDPKNAELILIDPKKGVDFGWLDGMPHMKRPLITEVEEAKQVFDELVKVMDERFERLSAIKAPNINYYNRQVASEERMSRIFLVHDELGAWMAQEKEYQEVVLSAVANLGMKARAAGIHLVLITQRADADAVPTKLRDNMGNRLCLKVQNSTGSRMVLGTGGAEKLLGKGHMACMLSNQSAPAGQGFFVVQVPFAEPDEMQSLADAVKDYW
ncbi:S-DNA-T family DNA segregation ATPase FtsK/SpoIIIE [Halomonas alkaliantarctica]|nr:S-DNA-T family DNA segregation ATPase FtsK/SpoIIIE [Halomonas alkaliantarctica]